MQELELHKFDPRVINKRRMDGRSPIMVFLGARSTGKSVLVKDISSYIKDIPLVVAMSGTEEGNGFYSEFVHPLFIYNKFEPEVLVSIINHQKRKADVLRKQGKQLKYEVNEHVCIILDDLAFDKSMMKLDAMRELFFNGRHYGITLILTFQYLMEIRPEYRTNVDFVFVCRENKKDNIEKLHKYFFGIFDKLPDFKKTLISCTTDYRAIVLENTCKSERIEDQVFWYKAKIDLKFRMCEEKWPLWDTQLKKKTYNEDSDDEEKTFTRKQKNSDIIIKMKGPRKRL
jgi:hypothetical protein